jgi:hypothetical protein
MNIEFFFNEETNDIWWANSETQQPIGAANTKEDAQKMVDCLNNIWWTNSENQQFIGTAKTEQDAQKMVDCLNDLVFSGFSQTIF